VTKQQKQEQLLDKTPWETWIMVNCTDESTPEELKFIEINSAKRFLKSAGFLNHTRIDSVKMPRQIIMHWMILHTSLTLVEIGSIFSKDHSTVLHSYRKIEMFIETRDMKYGVTAEDNLPVLERLSFILEGQMLTELQQEKKKSAMLERKQMRERQAADKTYT